MVLIGMSGVQHGGFLYSAHSGDMPVQIDTGVKHSDLIILGSDMFRITAGGIAFFQCQLTVINGQPVKPGTIQRDKGLELVEGIVFFKHMRQTRHRIGGGVDTSTATRLQLGGISMGSTVRAEEELGSPTSPPAAGRDGVLPLGHRQAVIMRPDPSRQNMIAVDHQVMRRDRCRQILNASAT